MACSIRARCSRNYTVAPNSAAFMSMRADCHFPTCRAFELGGVMTRLTPADLGELRDAVNEALAAEEPIELVAGETKRALGRPLQVPRTLDLSALAGIRDYRPSELVLTAGAATRLDEIDAALAQARQMLAFEPPDWAGLFALPASAATRETLGGVLACNLSGPRRIKAGAARDHFLGFRGVSGRGEVFKAGGKVVKNVTGYDLCKLMAGSYGTLAALEEVTIKVLPRPEKTRTVLLLGLDDGQAVAAMTAALNAPYEVSGAAHLPVARARGSAVSYVAAAGTAVTLLRLEGPGPSVAHRCAALRAELAAFGASEELHSANSALLWREIGDAALLAGDDAGRVVWRLSLPPASAPAVIATLARRGDITHFLDWGGGLLWLAVGVAHGGGDDGGAAAI